LRVDLLDFPDVDNVIRSEELVGGPFAPAIECQLKIPHEIFSGQNGVTLNPNDRLGEVQAAGFQHRGKIAKVAVATPDIKPPTRLQYPSDVGEPREEKSTEYLHAEEIIGQGSVFRPQLLGRWFRLLRVAFDVEFLVVLRPCERTKPGGNRVIGPRLDPDAVGRVGDDQVDRSAVDQVVDILGLAAIPTLQPVLRASGSARCRMPARASGRSWAEPPGWR